MHKYIQLKDLGLVDYQLAWNYQEELFNGTILTKINNRDLPDKAQTIPANYFLLCEHPHVYTLGKSGNIKNLLLDEAGLAQAQASFYKINRGGDITYHGPGQIVGYPIFDLDQFFTDIHKFLRYLEEIIIQCCADYHIHAGRIDGLTGVWVDYESPEKARKICAMGIRASRWVTMHGFAFNVNTNLNYFNHIIPCGIDDKAVTSLAAETGYYINEHDVKMNISRRLLNLFEAQGSEIISLTI
jgi:lipoyl(octanoyl) transferase